MSQEYPLASIDPAHQFKTSDDLVYEQDILRDPGKFKPWLSYVEFKQQHGNALEQAYVSR